VGGADPRFVLFVPSPDPDTELWTGPVPGPEGAAERFGADETFPLSELPERLPRLLQDGDRIHYRFGRGDGVERMVLEALARARMRGPRKGTGPRGVVDPGEILDEMRLVKDVHEIARLRAAAELSVEGQRAAAGALGPGRGEWMVEAAVDGCFRRGGAAGPAYGTIVGSGPNACVLHYVANARVMERGEVVLVDAGAELALYAGDVTRTWPVDGRFTAAQRAVYDVVERARASAVDLVGPGVTTAQVHDVAVRVLTEGLVALGVLAGDPDTLVEEGAYKAWYPHQTSHWIGLDVHDPGDYARGGAARALEAGMVFTVEPGLYFRADADGPAKPYAGIGVRIEDDVLVTAGGHENLTRALPTAAEEVEAMVGGRG
jgi:Xaa-Pro aminopeptidase